MSSSTRHLLMTDFRFELSQIAWWLLEVYFGLDASGFESARKLCNPLHID